MGSRLLGSPRVFSARVVEMHESARLVASLLLCLCSFLSVLLWKCIKTSGQGDNGCWPVGA